MAGENTTQEQYNLVYTLGVKPGIKRVGYHPTRDAGKRRKQFTVTTHFPRHTPLKTAPFSITKLT